MPQAEAEKCVRGDAYLELLDLLLELGLRILSSLTPTKNNNTAISFRSLGVPPTGGQTPRGVTSSKQGATPGLPVVPWWRRRPWPAGRPGAWPAWPRSRQPGRRHRGPGCPGSRRGRGSRRQRPEGAAEFIEPVKVRARNPVRRKEQMRGSGRPRATVEIGEGLLP